MALAAAVAALSLTVVAATSLAAPADASVFKNGRVADENGTLLLDEKGIPKKSR